MIQAGLEQILDSCECPPLSVRGAAKRLKYDPTRLAKLFPDECDQIRQKYLAYRGVKRVELAVRVRDEIRKTVQMLDANGVYPSINQMRNTLAKPGVMRSPGAIAAYYEVMEELGYR